eukprot:2942-Eustigmatos_ZCMA.PRE.1
MPAMIRSRSAAPVHPGGHERYRSAAAQAGEQRPAPRHTRRLPDDRSAWDQRPVRHRPRLR